MSVVFNPTPNGKRQTVNAINPTRVFNDQLMQSMRKEGDPIADQVIAEVVSERGMAGLGQLMAFLGKTREVVHKEETTPALLPTPSEKYRPGHRRTVPPASGLAGMTNEQRLRTALASGALDFGALPGPEFPEVVHQYFATNSQLPSWADLRRMAEGSAFYWQHLDQLMMLLGCYSLPYCYAAADGAQVLYLSQRIGKDTDRRLLETAQFVMEVMRPDAFSEKGLGVLTTRKIRLVHAAVRYYSSHNPQWNNDWGLPVNQEDMAGTNLAMSYIAIRGLRKIGVQLDEQASEAYLHLWNVVGYLLGVNEALLPANLREAYHLDRIIARRNFRKSEAGISLTRSLLDSLAEYAPSAALKQFPANQMRLLLGDEIANLLEIPTANWTRSLVKSSQIRNFFQSLRTA